MTIEVAETNWKNPEQVVRLQDVKDNEAAKRAIEVALCGSHEIVFLASVRSPAAALMNAACRLAQANGLPFKGKVIPVCPCGAHGSPKDECECSREDMIDYARQTMPLLRNADLIIHTVEPRARQTNYKGEDDATIIARIKNVRNQTPSGSQIVCPAAEDYIRMAVCELKANRDKIVKVAKTIANMDFSQDIQAQHVTEAIQYQHACACKWFDFYSEVSC